MTIEPTSLLYGLAGVAKVHSAPGTAKSGDERNHLTKERALKVSSRKHQKSIFQKSHRPGSFGEYRGRP